MGKIDGGTGPLTGNSRLEGIIPKNHFVSLRFFREAPLINWNFTKACLFTAFDFYRSSDFWTDSVLNSGKTLKEALVELGFPKDNSLIVDTGIFELEAKKAGISKQLGIGDTEINIQLSNRDIFTVYDISGADYFVAPDEIILATDNPSTVQNKIETIKRNLLETLEHVSSSQVIAVIQGQETSVIDSILNFYHDHGIRHFAAGGLIPMYFYDKSLFQRVVTYIRKATEGYHLHAFGLPVVGLLPYYLHKLQFNSVDTSALLYLSANRKYLVRDNPIPVRLAKFGKCKCDGCKYICREQPYSRQPEFFIHLYIHNVCEAAKIADNSLIAHSNDNVSKSNSKVHQYNAPLKKTEPNLSSKFSNKDSRIEACWKSADELLTSWFRNSD